MTWNTTVYSLSTNQPQAAGRLLHGMHMPASRAAPVPLLNFVSDLKSGRPPTADTYVPLPLLSQGRPSAVLPLKARSVPCSSVTYLRECKHARGFGSAVDLMVHKNSLQFHVITVYGGEACSAEEGVQAVQVVQEGGAPKRLDGLKLHTRSQTSYQH
jgi:hypothetical protein